MHRARPHAQLAVRLDILVSWRFVLDRSNLLKLASITGGTTNVLETENHADHLDDCQKRHFVTRARMEPVSLKVVQLLGASGVDGSRVREFSGLRNR